MTSRSQHRNVVITGLGIVSPIGIGVERFWTSLRSGTSGIDKIRAFDVSALPPECRIAGEVRDFDAAVWIPRYVARSGGRFSHFALAAAKMAAQDSDFPFADVPDHRIMVSFGTSMSGLVDVFLPAVRSFDQGHDMNPWAAREFPAQAATTHITNELGAATGMTLSTGCAAGLDAITWAAGKIKHGDADAVIAGATETPLSPPTLDAFRLYGLLSKWSGPPAMASRPFDVLRSGLVVAEGAAAVFVEEEEHARRRGAHIYAVLPDLGTATEPPAAFGHIELSGDTAARSMTSALNAARRTRGDVDYICAHGNSIPDHDISETAGIKRAFGTFAPNIPISSIKSMCGQAFAASGVMQVVTACMALKEGIVPPTINYLLPDPQCDLDYVPNVARFARVRHALVHTRSLGGTHVSLVLSRYS